MASQLNKTGAVRGIVLVTSVLVQVEAIRKYCGVEVNLQVNLEILSVVNLKRSDLRAKF